MKQAYEEPKVEVIAFLETDIVVASQDESEWTDPS